MPQKDADGSASMSQRAKSTPAFVRGLVYVAESMPEGRAEPGGVVREPVGRAVMEASGRLRARLGGGRRAAGVEVRIVDPKRSSPLRQVGRAAGQERSDRRHYRHRPVRRGVSRRRGLPTAIPRVTIDRLVAARTALKDVEDRIKQQGEHGPPPIVAKALAAIAKTTRAELRRLEAAIAAKIKANPGFARRAEIYERAGPRRSDRRRRNRLAARSGASATKPPPFPTSALRPTTTTAAGAKASATSRADAASSATSSLCRSWPRQPGTIRCSRPTTSACARAKPRSPSSPACAS